MTTMRKIGRQDEASCGARGPARRRACRIAGARADRQVHRRVDRRGGRRSPSTCKRPAASLASSPRRRLVLDLVGGAVGRASLSIVRDGGLLISIPSAGDIAGLRDLANGRIRVTGMLVEPDRAGIEAVAALAADGRLRADVAQTFPLEEASRAHDLGERGAIGGGKLVLTPGS